MRSRLNSRACLRAALLLPMALHWSCGGGSRGPAPDPPAGAPDSGATVVRGNERVAWTQPGHNAGWSFVAHVDSQPVPLPDVTCQGSPDAACSAALPPLSDGLHTFAIAAMSSLGEGPRSESITLQKISAQSVASAIATAITGTVFGDAAFSAEVVGPVLNGPVQLSAAGDGRLLAASADRRIHAVDPSEAVATLALDAAAFLEPAPVGPLGVAAHPEFERNRLVYLGFVADDNGRPLLRIVRVRDAGGILGEAATLHESEVRDVREVTGSAALSGSEPLTPPAGPRLSFGPDGLLYVLLPNGLVYVNNPAASLPHAALLRLRDDGRAPAEGPISGLDAHPLGFGWAPETKALLGILPASESEAVVRTIGEAPGVVTLGSGARLRLASGSQQGALALAADPVESATLTLARTFSAALAGAASGAIRLTAPIEMESVAAGLGGQVVDAVAHNGTLYVAIDDPALAGRQSSIIVRLTRRR